MSPEQATWSVVRSGETVKGVPTGLRFPNNQFNTFIGSNNSGKTALLLSIFKTIGDEKACYVSPQRFEASEEIPYVQDSNKEVHRTSGIKAAKRNTGENEANVTDFVSLLASYDMKDFDRLKLWVKSAFNSEIELTFDEQKVVRTYQLLIDGRKPRLQGSGARSMLNFLIRVFDPKVATLLIDEPELSIEPKTQKKIFQLLKQISLGVVVGLPAKQIYIATHSHLFLDRQDLGNNYIIEKDNNGNVKEPTRMTSEQVLYERVFEMLGVTPDDLFLPRNIIVVEGQSDAIFLGKVLNNLLPNTGISFHFADGDNRIPGATKSIDDLLKATVHLKGFYRDRLCVLFDQQVSAAYVSKVKGFLSDDGTRVHQTDKSDIELYYPTAIISELAGIEADKCYDELKKYIEQYDKSKQIGTLGSLSISKVELAGRVSEKLPDNTGIDKKLIQFLEIAVRFSFK